MNKRHNITMSRKHKTTLNERKLNMIIKESVKRVLNEDANTDNIREIKDSITGSTANLFRNMLKDEHFKEMDEKNKGDFSRKFIGCYKEIVNKLEQLFKNWLEITGYEE